MMMKKAFTMIEMLIVIIIIGLLMVHFKNVFSYKNVEDVKFDTCYIHTYSKLTKFMQDALLQKMALSGFNYEKVNKYSIVFDTQNQKLLLIYSGDTKVVDEFQFHGTKNSDNKHSCRTKTYYSQISGDKLTIDINPGLSADINQKAIDLYTGSSTNSAPLSYTGIIIMNSCRGNYCQQKYRFLFIPSTYLLITQYCMKLNINTGKCEQWSF